MAKPTIAVRVTTRKGKDMLKLLNGEWADVISETETEVTFRAPEVVYVGDQTPLRAFGIRFARTGEFYTNTYPKEYIEDHRPRCSAAREERILRVRDSSGKNTARRR